MATPADSNQAAQGVTKTATQDRKTKTGRTVISGADLSPKLDGTGPRGGHAKQYLYWVGVTSACPVAHIHMAGIAFPKMNADLIDDPLGGPMKKAQPFIGSVVPLNEAKIKLLRDRLPRTIVRLYEGAESTETGTGEDLSNIAQKPRRGQLITIPTREEVEARRAAGKSTQEYVQGPNDVPAARFMFAVLCEDQVRGSRGNVYPDTLETSGLEWPEAIQDN